MTGKATFTVYDVSGARVWETRIKVSHDGPSRLHWDGRNHDGQKVPPGVYLVRLETGAEIVRTKVSVAR